MPLLWLSQLLRYAMYGFIELGRMFYPSACPPSFEPTQPVATEEVIDVSKKKSWTPKPLEVDRQARRLALVHFMRKAQRHSRGKGVRPGDWFSLQFDSDKIHLFESLEDFEAALAKLCFKSGVTVIDVQPWNYDAAELKLSPKQDVRHEWEVLFVRTVDRASLRP